VRNAGQVSANNVRAELTLAASLPLFIKYPSEMPNPPRKRGSMFDVAPALRNIRAAFRSPGDVTIEKNDERIRIEIDCGNLQPGRRVWSGVILVATGGEAAIAGQVFAENLPQPKHFALTMFANVTKIQMGISELRALPEPKERDDQ
jgi:hypothetical protein